MESTYFTIFKTSGILSSVRHCSFYSTALNKILPKAAVQKGQLKEVPNCKSLARGFNFITLIFDLLNLERFRLLTTFLRNTIMNKTFTIAAAALSGILAGSAARAAVVSTPSSTGGSHLIAGAGQKAIAMDDAGKHDCKGQNACKGQGGCKTGDNGCKGKNSCKGNGGCKTNGATTAPGL